MYLRCQYLKVRVCEGPESVVQGPQVGEGGEEAGEEVPGETSVRYVQLLHQGELLLLQARDTVVLHLPTLDQLDGADPGED